MLRADRALRLNIKGAPELPRVDAFRDLYKYCHPRRGEFIMVTGRSGSGKSTFAEYWVSQMKVPTLYFSGDMSPREASVKLVCSALSMDADAVEYILEEGGERAQDVYRALKEIPITFSFGEITWHSIDAEIEAYIELWNMFPEVIVVDNLMDIEDCDSDYQMQQQAMQNLHNISRRLGATVIVLHHATDKSLQALSDPFEPPARRDIKNGMSEKPQLIFGVALNPYDNVFRLSVLKQRMGKSDQSGTVHVELNAIPNQSRYEGREAYGA